MRRITSQGSPLTAASGITSLLALLYTSTHRKDAKWLLVFGKEFLCVLCASAVNRNY
jgi:hypothetical protein